MTELCINQLFEQQAHNTPLAVALRSAEHSITYEALNRRANCVGQYLRQKGVGPEVFVGVCLERSVEAVIAILGILKAGGAYVYLDPHHPKKRLEELAADCNLSIILTAADMASVELSSESDDPPPSTVTPDDAAYLLYTSGSTGKPKGVIEIHRSLTARLAAGPLPDIQNGDVCSLNSSLGFGITASRLFLPLVCGAIVVVLADSDVKDPRRFVEALVHFGVTSVFLPPTLLRTLLLLTKDVLGMLTQLRVVTATGAAVTPDLARSFFQAFPRTQLVNVYGSAEIGTTAALCVMGRDSVRTYTSIGRPVSHTRLYLLDENLHPVTEGEIHVGSAHLARGYLNQPDLTREKFVGDPFLPGARIYRTGDLGRYLPDGEIQFLGRQDHQVKVRGNRVELGEIETTIESHPHVLEAIIVAEDAGTDKQLIAYVIPQAGLRVSELRRFASERLPDFMVPSAFVLLGQFPRTDSGKVDRNALPAYYPHRPDVDTFYEVPVSTEEIALAQIWSEMLRVKRVGINDNFIELGGDSIAAVQVILQVRARWSLDLTLDSLFEETLGGLAAELTRCNLNGMT